MKNKPHWSIGLSQMEVFNTAYAGWTHDNDHTRCHTDGELLEFLEVFNDSLGEHEVYHIQNFNQYLIPHQNHIAIPLTAFHIETICLMLADWLDDNDLEE